MLVITKSLFSVIIGSLIVFLMRSLNIHIIPNGIEIYLPVFLGAIVAGLIASTKRMWLIGCVISFVDLSITWLILYKMAIANSMDFFNLITTTIGVSEILKHIGVVLAGIVGAYIGNFLKVFFIRRVILR